MPQNYGATSPPITPASRRQLGRDGRTPQATPAKSIASPEPQGTVFSSTVNLANTTIGAGALAFPSAFAAMGLVHGIASCLISATTAAFGLYLLSRCATQVGQRPGDEWRKPSFNEVARISFGKGWITRLFDVSWELRRLAVRELTCQLAIAIKCFGVSVSYLIICKVSSGRF